MKIKVKKIWRHELVNNGQAIVEINGVAFETIRQGMLGFWAGKFRVSKDFTQADFKLIDSTLDQALAKFDAKRSA